MDESSSDIAGGVDIGSPDLSCEWGTYSSGTVREASVKERIRRLRDRCAGSIEVGDAYSTRSDVEADGEVNSGV